MLVALLVTGTVSYISGRMLCSTVDSALSLAESYERVSIHRFAGKRFSVNTNQEYRDLMQGVSVINQITQSAKVELAMSSAVEDCYRICLTEGVIEWGLGGDASYTSLVANLTPDHHEQYVRATKGAWESLSSRQVGAMFCLAHFYSPD